MPDAVRAVGRALAGLRIAEAETEALEARLVDAR